MKKLNIQHVTSILSMLFFLSACDRMAVEDSKVSLKLPKTVSGKAGAQSVSTLKHIAVQVTAADMAEPVTLILDSHDSQALPSEVTLEIPSGNNRLIQVLAAYGTGSNDDNAIIYYGDVTKTLIGGTDTADVPLDNLSGTLPEEEGRIYGRYLTAANQGPSGELKMVYRPAGKPGIVVDRRFILGGWFEATVFKNVAVDYVLPDGSLLGNQWTVESLPVSKHLLRLRMPAHSERKWENNTNNWRDRGVENKFLGFFAAQTSLLDDKKVCSFSKTSKNNGDVYFGNKYLGPSILNVMPIKAFFTGTTPQTSANFASIIGGMDISACSTLPLTEEFSRYLVLDNSNYGNELWESFEGLSGYRGGQAAFREKSMDGLTTYRNTVKQGANSNGPYFEVSLLPGLKDSITSYQIYKATQGSYAPMGYDNRCEPSELSKQGWILLRTNALPAGAGDFVRFTPGNIGFTLDPYTSYMLCLSKNNIPLGSQIPFGSWAFTASPPEGMNLILAGNQFNQSSQPVVHECRRIEVALTTPQGNIVNANGVTATLSAQGQAVLYTDATCSTTAASSLSISLPAGTHFTSVYTKSATPLLYNVSIDSNSAGLNLPPPLPFSVVDAPTTVSHLDMVMNSSQWYSGTPAEMKLFKNGCFPMMVRLTNAGLSVDTSGTVNFAWYKLDGTTAYTPPTGTRLVNNCTSKSPISQLSYSNSAIAEFAIEVGAEIPANASLKADGFGFSAKIAVNNSPLVHHLAIRLAGGSTSTPAVGSCQAVEFVAKNASDQDVAVPAGQVVSFIPTTIYYPGSSGTLVEFFDSSSCSYNSNNYGIAAGESVKTIYMKAKSPQMAEITYQSEHTERTHGYNSDLISKLTINPVVLPLLVPVPDPVVLVGNTVTLYVQGGVPPYSIQKISGAASHYYSEYGSTLNVTAEGIGAIQLSVTDSMGIVYLVNLTGQ
ncbi:hypothetical protein [Bdellovibrio bacteriovorus]|uniref:Hemagglutinin/hemolysin-related protein n=1 Tax=Bdellovibrio bacteriovorus str. Tiberius TaxID=1069642 RepID=K7ZG89_BDEBC|nr:hypothetical protein [Bdellovibrio bacteriovorus]AFY02237.1 hypothetical protein Bdt_2554 [Bdellovibrio bacteriovorus str. Tiberius]